MTSFNWNISAGSFPDTYQISSVDDPFAISFTSDLNLIDKGEDSEHYRFQITFDKKVIPSTSLTDDDSSTVCFYNSTTFQSYIYTKMSQDYPPSDMKTTNASYAPWPYAVRVEEVAGGGDSVPNCYKANNGVIGERVKSDSLKAQDAGALCDCLYMNWIP